MNDKHAFLIMAHNNKEQLLELLLVRLAQEAQHG